MHKILITEDEAVIAIELEKTLLAMGHEVVGTAGSWGRSGTYISL